MKNRYIMLFLGISLWSYGQVFAYKDAPIAKDTLTKIKEKLDSLPMTLSVRFLKTKPQVSYLNENLNKKIANTDSLLTNQKIGYLELDKNKDKYFDITDQYRFRVDYTGEGLGTIQTDKKIAKTGINEVIFKYRSKATIKIDSVFVRMDIDSIASLNKTQHKKLDTLMKGTNDFAYKKSSFVESYNKKVPSKIFEVLEILRGLIYATLNNVWEKYKATSYSYGGGYEKLRIEETAEALATMDCTEFVARYLKELGVFTTTPNFSTGAMAKTESFEKEHKDQLMYIENSHTDIFIPQAGDIFIYNGHTGIVIEYIKNGDKVRVIEALGNSGSAEGSLSPDKGAKKNEVTRRTYTRLGKSLQKHKGWVGYYRPIVK